MMTGKTILVTGGAGFIGSHTVNALLAQNHRVIVLDNLSSGLSPLFPLAHSQLMLVEGDIIDFETVKKYVSQSDAVLHLAAIASVHESIENPLYTFQVNVQGFLNVLEAIRMTKRAQRLVYASSAAVYGNETHLPCSDDKPLSTEVLSPYALHKRQNEHYAELYQRLYGISSLGLRYFNVYGEGQNPASFYSGVISRFLYAYQQQEKLTVFGDGQQSRDFISVHDVVAANVLALMSSAIGVCNIATGEAQTLTQLIDYIAKNGDSEAKIVFAPARSGDILKSYGATERAKNLLNFQTKINLSAGIAELIKNPSPAATRRPLPQGER